MWVFGKIKESMEGIPLELSRYMGKSEEDLSVSSKDKLHNNILTPDKIPEFFLPPRLCKRSPPQGAETTPPYLLSQDLMTHSNSPLDTNHMKTNDEKTKSGDLPVSRKAAKNPLPFSAEGYGLAGIYESLNTRRKESLFHSKCPTYILDRSIPTAAPKLATQSKNTSPLAGILPLFSHKKPSQAQGIQSETPSSSDSSPLSSPYSTKTSLSIPSGSGRLKGATSCPSLIDNREDKGRWEKGALSLTTSPSSPPSLEGSSLTLAPPILFPLDVLQCQERLQREHVLPLQGYGRVRLSAERTAFPTNMSTSLSTVRIRLVSVEGLRDEGDKRILNCAVSVCLTPGKLQQQESATIRNCRSPVFNEDFFFTELSREDLLELQLRLKVLDKPAAGTLRRMTVIGVITKPLSQLLPLKIE
ncbi:C2 calcium-dependent domain-containing protein 4C [Aulostomus maculatus]